MIEVTRVFYGTLIILLRIFASYHTPNNLLINYFNNIGATTSTSGVVESKY